VIYDVKAVGLAGGGGHPPAPWGGLYGSQAAVDATTPHPWAIYPGGQRKRP